MGTVELSARVRVSDPRPSHCSACFRGADETVRFVDMDAALDRGSIVTDQGAVVGTIDDLHLCEACVRAAAQTLALKPDLHARQAIRIRELENEVEQWKQVGRDGAKRLAEQLDRLAQADKPEKGKR